MSDPAPARERDLGIDLLRGIAILGVIVAHLWNFSVVQGSKALPPAESVLMRNAAAHLQNGQLVDAFTSSTQVFFKSIWVVIPLFFMLSGATLTLAAERTSWHGGAVDFYRKRLSKVLRSYWAGFAVVIITLVLLAIPKTLLDGGSFGTNATRAGYIGYYDRAQFLAGLALVPRGFSRVLVLAPPATMYFVFVLLQYYLLFPYLFRAFRKFGMIPLLATSFAVSVMSTFALIWHNGGQIGLDAWIISMWFPFRMFEFTLGMVIGSLAARSAQSLTRSLSRPFLGAACLLGGVAISLAGATLSDGQGYLRSLAFPVIATGVTVAALPIVFKTPGRTETSLVGRIFVWMGVISLPVLIMNEPFRLVNHYLWIKSVYWTPAWWVYIVAIYVPGTLAAAALLARVLRLTPAGHPTELLRTLRLPAALRPERATAPAYRARRVARKG